MLLGRSPCGRSLDLWMLGSPLKSLWLKTSEGCRSFPPSSLSRHLKPSFVHRSMASGTEGTHICVSTCPPLPVNQCASVFPRARPFVCSGIASIGIAKETPVYTVTCFGPTDIYLLLCNEGNLHSTLKIWPHWLVLPLPQWFLRGERPQSTDASLYSASRLREDLFRTCTLASVGAQAVKEALRNRVKSSWTWQGGSAFKGRCRILSYIILWDGPLKQNCVMGLALKSLACLTRLKGNDVKIRKNTGA